MTSLNDKSKNVFVHILAFDKDNPRKPKVGDTIFFMLLLIKMGRQKLSMLLQLKGLYLSNVPDHQNQNGHIKTEAGKVAGNSS